MTYPLGVDIGTTYTAAALWLQGRVQTVPLGNRANAVPSVLFLREDGTMLVGEAAVPRGIADPDRQAREFKRRMGDDVPLQLGGRGFTAHELTGRVLRWTVDKVSELQDGPPSHVVLTHPAEWGGHRTGLLAQAAHGVGLRNVGLLAEPVAAATWYAAQERVEPGSLIGIYDFGGGTFDASLVRKTGTGVELYGEPGGDDRIGGIDFDHALLRHVTAAAGTDLSQLDPGDPTVASSFAQLFASVIDAKEALSSDTEAVVPVMLPGVTRQVLVTRAEFEDLIRQQVLGTVGVFGQVVRRAGADPASLHTVLLVGGTSRIPLVRELLSRELGIRVAVDAHPKYTVSLGAAIAAAPRVAPPARQRPAPARPGPPGPPGMPPQHRPVPPRPPGPTGARQPWSPAPAAGPPGNPPQPAPVVTEKVDLARTGLTTATDVSVGVPQVQLSSPGQHEGMVVVRTKGAEAAPSRSRGRLIAAAVVLLVVGVVAAVVLFAQQGEESTADGPRGRASGPLDKAIGTVGMSGALVTAPAGADRMTGVADLGDGRLVGVGVSAKQRPRAWLRSGGSWTAVEPPFESRGEMTDVAVAGGRAVAVGVTGTAAGTRPAVWTSGNGRTWDLAPASGDFAAGSSVVQLTAIALGPDGKLLAAGQDKGTDSDGDAALFTSADGTSWTRVRTHGLGGPGPQEIGGITVTADGVAAVGSMLSGASSGPAVWKSKDGTRWELSDDLPGGAPQLTGVAEQQGKLLVCGNLSLAPETAGVSCWLPKDGGGWGRHEPAVAGKSPDPMLLYGLLDAGGKTTVVGAGRSGKQVDAAVWTLAFD